MTLQHARSALGQAACLKVAALIICYAAAFAWAAEPLQSQFPGQTSLPDVVLRPAPMPVTREYFGLHMSKLLQPHHGGKTSSWPDLDIGSWRLWGAYVAWRDIEPQRGAFKFDWLDSYVRMAEAKRVELVLTLGMTPTWAASRAGEACIFGPPGCASEPARLEDWEHYVTSVVRRYRGRIKAYEIWNEPVFSEDDERKPSQVYFSGSARSMVDMARIAYGVIKREDPAALVLSPAVVSRPARLATFLRAGGVGTFDVVAYHFYGAPPERLVEDAVTLRKVLVAHGIDKLPVWNTEMGYYFERPALGIAAVERRKSFEDVLPERLGAAYVLRSLVLGAALDFQRFHWYDWDSEKLPWELPMGLGSDDGQRLNPAGRAYGRAVQWLRGRVIEQCQGSRGGLWECRLRQGALRSMLVWSAGSAKSWKPPKAAYAGELDDKGCFRAISASDSIVVGPMPWLIFLDEGAGTMPSPVCSAKDMR